MLVVGAAPSEVAPVNVLGRVGDLLLLIGTRVCYVSAWQFGRGQALEASSRAKFVNGGGRRVSFAQRLERVLCVADGGDAINMTQVRAIRGCDGCTRTHTFTLSSLVRHNPHATHYIVGVYLVAMTLLWAENDVPPAVRWMMSFFLSFLLVMGHRMVGSTSVFKQLAIITSPELCQRDTHTHIHIHPAMPIGQVRTGSERAGSQETHGRSRIAFWWVMGFFVTAHRYMPFFDDAPACDARAAVW